MKKLKKTMAFLMVFVLSLSCIIPIKANAAETPIKVNSARMSAKVNGAEASYDEDYVYDFDIYAERLVESIEVNGIVYSFAYMYDEAGRQTTVITNDRDTKMDIVKYDESSGKIYANGIQIGETSFSQQPLSTRAANENWIKISSGSTKITWEYGAGWSVIATLIAKPLDKVGVLGVIAKMGIDALAALSTSAEGGTVSLTVYQANTSAVISYKYVWSFTSDKGQKFGPYTTGITI